MAYTLEITFTGLYMFVPDPDRNWLHVLLPRTSHGQHQIDPHMALLEYDPAHDSSTTDLPPLNLDGTFIDLSGLPGAGILSALPETIADAGDLVSRKVRSTQLEHTPDLGIKARIRVSAPRLITGGPSALWELGPKEIVYLTNHVKLAWRVNGSDLRFSIVNGNPITKRLRPNSDGLLRLHFTHLPLNEPNMGIGDEAEHFHAYYHVFGELQGPKPRLRERPRPVPPPLGPSPTVEEKIEKAKSLSTFTCMVAQAPLE